MKHYIKDNIYYIEDENGKVLLTIKLTEDKTDMLKNQIELETETEKYAGPVELLLK